MSSASTTIHLLTPPDPSAIGWQSQAECRKSIYSPELWHPVGTSGPALVQAAKAKTICRSCPVLASCKAWALDVLEYGIAGGLDETERRLVRRQREAARKAVAG